MGRHEQPGRTNRHWWPGWKSSSKWLVTQILLAVLVIGAILLLNLIPGIHIPDWDELHN